MKLMLNTGRTIDAEVYIQTAHKAIQKEGFPNLTEDKVKVQVTKILLRKAVSEIGEYMKDEIDIDTSWYLINRDRLITERKAIDVKREKNKQDFIELKAEFTVGQKVIILRHDGSQEIAFIAQRDIALFTYEVEYTLYKCKKDGTPSQMHTLFYKDDKLKKHED